MKTMLIADSGSTKTDWVVCRNEEAVLKFNTQGINPFMLGDEALQTILADEMLPRLSGWEPAEVRFYGAGCRDAQAVRVREQLERLLPQARVAVASDLLCAARALCGDEAGIACILGTGSNSCYFDGREIRSNVSPLGYILGDEGSGAVLGRRLVGDVLKEQLPREICEAFMATYGLTPAGIIERVYRQPFPNRFLAGFAPFLREHAGDAAVRSLVSDEFSRFLVRNVLSYNCPELPVHFVGSIAWHFSDILTECVEGHSLKCGRIFRTPLERLEYL